MKSSRSLVAVAVAVVSNYAVATDSSVRFIGADQVHAQGITGRGVTIAAIDTWLVSGQAFPPLSLDLRGNWARLQVEG